MNVYFLKDLICFLFFFRLKIYSLISVGMATQQTKISSY